MKTKLLLLSAMATMMVCQAQSADFETATETVKAMGVGWNLGNTLDAHSQKVTSLSSTAYWGQQGLESENCWGQPTTKPELFRMMKNAGFGAIRVPVTWYNHMDSSGKVNAAWMKRVHEVVDYVVNAGLYCILNVHHDTGADESQSTHWLKADADNYANNKERYEYLWKQIAEEFKDYDQHLLFESYNEMLDKLNSWCFASYNSSSHYDAAIAASAYQAINSYAQSFVNVVRETGGNNANRNLVVNTYAACSGAGSWNTHLRDPLREMQLPDDVAENHLIFQIHCYPSLKENNLTSIKSEVHTMLSRLNTDLVAKGAPVIIGEWGTQDYDSNKNYEQNKANYFSFCQYLVQQAKASNIATFYWMGLSDGSSRNLPAFSQPDLAETIVKAYHGENFQGVFPKADDFNIEYEVKYTQQYAELYLYSGTPLSLDVYKGIRLEMSELPRSGALKMKAYGNPTTKTQYGNSSISALKTTLTFNASTLGSSVSSVTLQSSYNGELKAKLNKVFLLKKDGTEELFKGVTPFWGCTLEANARLADKAQILKICSYIAGNTEGVSLNDVDVNGDGLVTIADIVALTN